MHCLSCTEVSAFRPKWVAVTGRKPFQPKALFAFVSQHLFQLCGMRARWWSKTKVTNWIDSGGARARRCNDDETATSRTRRRRSSTALPIICTALLLGLMAQVGYAH